MNPSGISAATLTRRRAGRALLGRVFLVLCLGAVALGLIVLAVLLLDIVVDGLPWLRLELFTQFPSRFVEKSGFRSALEGSLFMIALTAVLLPLGAGRRSTWRILWGGWHA
jgi:phosphate transport system permease protein